METFSSGGFCTEAVEQKPGVDALAWKNPFPPPNSALSQPLQPLRLLSWNVNGLKGLCSRLGGMPAVLQLLSADVVCLQEHKMRRPELDSHVALVPGWESFYAFTRGKMGYSGVCTYVRSSISMPVTAEEGLTGSLMLPPGSKPSAVMQLASLWHDTPLETLVALDSEGRVVITDHGAFVLFNVYAPAITSEEKMEERQTFKNDFNNALGKRMLQYHLQGRRVLVTGDFNITPDPRIDRADVDPDYSPATDASPWRQWLRSMCLGKGGPFADCFRVFHPSRRDAYTCWRTASSARVNNYGSRIDLVLAADGRHQPQDAAGAEAQLRTWIAHTDHWPDLQGSDHAPVWSDLQLPADELPKDGPAPLLSTRHMFGTARQLNLQGWLSNSRGLGTVSGSQEGRTGSSKLGQSRSAPAAAVSSAAILVSDDTSYSIMHNTAVCSSQQSQADLPVHSLPSSAPWSQSKKRAAGSAAHAGTGAHASGSNKRGKVAVAPLKGTTLAAATKQISMFAFVQRPVPPSSSAAATPCPPAAVPSICAPHALHMATQVVMPDAATLRSSSSQPGDTLTANEINNPKNSATAAGDLESHLGQSYDANCNSQAGNTMRNACVEADVNAASGMLADDVDGSQPPAAAAGAGGSGNAAAKAFWQQVQASHKPPLCKGHGEACLIRTVKKKGSEHLGRQFWVCRRPDGLPPEGRCDTFIWAVRKIISSGQQEGARWSVKGNR